MGSMCNACQKCGLALLFLKVFDVPLGQVVYCPALVVKQVPVHQQPSEPCPLFTIHLLLARHIHLLLL